MFLRKFTAIYLVSLCLSVIAHAQDITGRQMDHYATMAGGWWLNQKCGFLGQNLKQEFEWHVAAITETFQRKLDSSKVRIVQQSAKKVAGKKTCGKESESIVLQTLLIARRLSSEVTGRSFDPKRSVAGYNARQYLLISAGIGMELRCSVAPAKGRKTLFDLYDAITNEMKNRNLNSAIVKGREYKNKVKSGSDYKCSSQTKGFVSRSFSEAKALGVALGVWSVKTGLIRK